MSHDPLAPIWQRLDSLQPVFFHADLNRALNADRDRLVDLGLLVEGTPSLHAQCTECGNGHLVRAVWVPNPATGRDDPRLPCPTCGPVPISADVLRRWVVDVPALLSAVCAAARIRAANAELVPTHLWYVGTATWVGRSQQVYFARATHARTRAAAVAALETRRRAVLLHPTEHALRLWGTATPNPGVALESVVGLDRDGLTFDVGAVADRLAETGPADPPPPPAPKRAVRASNIARLTEEVIEHLRRARAHAFATLDLSTEKQAELLERPTQKLLGEQVGLEPYEVSRCFADPTARELNLYWAMALDLGAVMNFRGPISTCPTA